MKVLSVIGVRPNFIKEFAVNRACEKLGIAKKVIHTGQHYDFLMSDVFFQQLQIPKPDYHFEILKENPVLQISQMMGFIADVIKEEKPDVVLVYGDVNSTMAAALAAVREKVPVAHIEAGVRGQSFYNPEEINRRVTDTVSEFLFPNIQEAYEALLSEGHPSERVFFCGDVMYDALLEIVRRFNITVTSGNYAVATLHREENSDDKQRLSSIVEALIKSPIPVKFPIHPRTRKKLIELGLMQRIEACEHIEVLEALGYLEFLKLLAGSRMLISDSGGARREAYMLGKPVVSLIEIVWVPAMVNSGWEISAGADTRKILAAIEKQLNPPPHRPSIFGEGDAAEKIMRTLKENYKKSEVFEKRTTSATTEVRDLAPQSLTAKRPVPVSVVIPMYNEEDSLPSLFLKLEVLRTKLIDREKYDVNFIFVNDGSSDKSLDLLKYKYQYDTKVRIINRAQNGGLGAAIRDGLNAATGELIVTIDADSNYDHYEIPTLLDAMEDGIDLVTASPFLRKDSWNYPSHRFVFSKGIVTLYKFALKGKGNQIHTFTSGFRVYRKSLLSHIQPEATDFLITAELLVRTLLTDHKVKEVYMTIHERLHGKSKLKTIKTIVSHLKFMKKVFFGLSRVNSPAPIKEISS